MRSDVLHALALKGMAGADTLAACVAGEPAEVAGELARLRADGLVQPLSGRGLWRITAAGRAAHAEWLEDDVPAGAAGRLHPWYERFVPLDRRFKAACTRWQLRDGVPNDHGDPGYDRAVVTELTELHEFAESVVRELALVRDRFRRYGERLNAALTRLLDGDQTAFTGVLRESYHDIWMELHRDLLLSLRIDRSAEERVGAAP